MKYPFSLLDILFCFDVVPNDRETIPTAWLLMLWRSNELEYQSPWYQLCKLAIPLSSRFSVLLTRGRPNLSMHTHYKVWKMKLLIHCHISTMQQLKFGNWYLISSHVLLDMWLLFHTGIKDNPCQQRGAGESSFRVSVLTSPKIWLITQECFDIF